MANEINATNIEAIDKLEAEAENIDPIDDVLAKAAKAYVNTAYKEQYEVECSSLVMSQDKWNGYDLLDAFKAGVKWVRENPEYKPMLVEYEDVSQSGQPCELCPFYNIANNENGCASLFEERFGGKCTKFGVRFVNKSLA